MRIIAGKYRGRRLKSPPSQRTRPTSDRLRETLFNILAPRIAGARFLDLCAGSGAVGIEAVSRGAEHVTFVDQSQRMRTLIQANLEALQVDRDRADNVKADAAQFVRLLVRQDIKPFDIVFFDPPYAHDYETVLNDVGNHAAGVLSKKGILVVEHSSRKNLNEQFGTLARYRELKQGDSTLSFYRHTAA